MRNYLVLTALVAAVAGYLAGYWRGQPPAGRDAGLDVVADIGAASSFVCPMHAQIVSDHPDSCPICGMDLVATEREGEADSGHGHGSPAVRIAPEVLHNLGVRTATVERGDLPRSIETIGKITRIDPMARRTLTPPIRGELVYVADKQQGDFVEDGELLFSVKSDALFEHEKTFQDAFLSGDRATAAAMVPELSRMGLSSEQIARLQAGDPPEMPVEVHAFEDGIVYTRRGKPGESVHTGFTVFNVGGNYRVVNVTAEIFERQWGWVREGQKAVMQVRGLPGVRFEGSVVRVEPPVGYTTRSLEVGLRFRTDNPGLSQSMFAHVTILGEPRRGVLLVPADAVIRTGEGDRVVLRLDDGRYQPVPVVAGEESGGLIEIRQGLAEGDDVVASGQFLIDSESSL
ncbi:MAG TPA: HlyD family efflux transporter periplasmic adaptor subunit, partial [Rhodospirillales bacterium]|nr:HlyD family efflux transporter periplasmic adaptor subunit [Rhodospirillales bacterium]